MRVVIAMVWLWLGASGVAAQLKDAAMWADSAARLIDAASVAGDAQRIVNVRALLDRALTRYPGDAMLLHYKGFACYREATIRLGRENADTDELLDCAEDALVQSVAALPIAESQALLSAVIGQKIGNNPIRGMLLGPKSDEWMGKAMRTAPANPRVWLLRGIGAIFKPGMFGGGLDKAESDLRKAIELFATDRPVPPAPAWGRAEAWIWLGQTLQRADRPGEAQKAYETALELERGNGWVRDVLLPGLKRRG